METSQQRKWLEKLLDKEYGFCDGVFPRKAIVDEMRAREIKAALDFELCHKNTSGHICTECGRRVERPSTCKNRLCPQCSSIRYAMIMRKYEKPVKDMVHPVLLTVSIGHIPLNYPEVLSYYRRLFYKLVRKLDSKIRSGFVVIELSPKFHLHFHAIIDTPYYIPQEELSQIWEKISGYEYVHIKKINNNEALAYLIKYVVKSPEFESVASYVNYYQMTKGRRLFSTIGALYKLKSVLKIKERCTCGSNELAYLHLEYVEHDFMIKYFGSMDKVP
ncbi:MAG: protein rep [Candidatus Aenigmarchaeota archaeon]|nr:protein rep [Candidatus Aenigmarchaeota archaeon]